jgi:hypothetical protein
MACHVFYISRREFCNGMNSILKRKGGNAHANAAYETNE